jgi:putative tricarboxylic transport membrane protein
MQEAFMLLNSQAHAPLSQTAAGRRARRQAGVVALVFLLLGGWISVESLQLPFGGFRMPGAGFFPLLLGMTLSCLALLLFVVQLLGDVEAETHILPARTEVLSLMGALFAAAWLFERAGYLLTMVLFLGVVLKMLARLGWLAAGILALAGSLATYILFGRLLLISLPSGILPF